MIDYTNPTCFQCERRSSCNFPCLNYSNYLIRQHHEKEAQNIQNSIKTLRNEISQAHKPTPAGVTEVDISDKSGDLKGLGELKKEVKNVNDIEDFLEFDVSNDKWLRAVNGMSSWIDIIDKGAFFDYLVEENEKYCAENCLCETCRSPLKEFTEMEDGMISQMYWSCSNGC